MIALLAYLIATLVAPTGAHFTTPVVKADMVVVAWDTKAPGEGWVQVFTDHRGDWRLDIQREDVRKHAHRQYERLRKVVSDPR